jgi:hypothetical protein
MVGRIATRYPLSCECGAEGVSILEEDDVHAGMEGGQNLRWSAEGQFRVEDGKTFICTGCGKKQ